MNNFTVYLVTMKNTTIPYKKMVFGRLLYNRTVIKYYSEIVMT